MNAAFMFLCKLAWASRFRIPLIISITFMVLDIRMQIEVNVQSRLVRRRLTANNGYQDDTISEAGSWITIEEEEEASGEDLQQGVELFA